MLIKTCKDILGRAQQCWKTGKTEHNFVVVFKTLHSDRKQMQKKSRILIKSS